MTIRVALVHSFYTARNPSGEDSVVRAELASLREHGVDVHLVSVATDDLAEESLYAVRAAGRVSTGLGRSPLDELRRLAPDVVHVHNLFPNFGRRWVDRLDAPLVHTLHNYRPLCANAYHFRDGAVCTLCPDESRLNALKHACYRDSRVATLPHVLAGLGGAGRDPLLQRADRLVMLSDLMRRQYVADGVAPEKIVLWPNFLPRALDQALDGREPRTGPFMTVGRLASEKGILELVRDWPAEHELEIFGDGELAEEITRAAGPSVHVRGRAPREEILARMRRSRGLVFPSRWFEGLPLVYLEALACGLPTVAIGPNVLTELVPADGTGIGLATTEHLGAALAGLDSDGLADHCRAVFEQTYTEDAYLERALGLYRELAG